MPFSLSHSYKKLSKIWKLNLLLQWSTHNALVNTVCYLPLAHYGGKVVDPQHVNLILVWESQFKGGSGLNKANKFREAKVVSSSACLYFCCRTRWIACFLMISFFQNFRCLPNHLKPPILERLVVLPVLSVETPYLFSEWCERRDHVSTLLQ